MFYRLIKHALAKNFYATKLYCRFYFYYTLDDTRIKFRPIGNIIIRDQVVITSLVTSDLTKHRTKIKTLNAKSKSRGQIKDEYRNKLMFNQ